jgi:multidrug efflux system membrane fusion protein
VTITQLQPISIVFSLSAAAVGQTRLTLGQTDAPVIAMGPDNIKELDRGKITLVDNQVDQTTGTIKLKASFPNLAQKLFP